MISALDRLRALRANKNEEAISWIEEQGLRYEYEERAAILEYDGGMSREEADKQAFRDIVKRVEYTVSGGNHHG